MAPATATCASTAYPEIDPAAVAAAEALLTARKVPSRTEWTPKQLATDLPGGGSPRTWRRRCESGEIQAVREGRDYVVLREWIVRYYAERWTGSVAA